MAETLQRWTFDYLGRPERVTRIGDRVALVNGRPIGDPDIKFEELGIIARASYMSPNGCEQATILVPVRGKARLAVEVVLRGIDNMLFGWVKLMLGE